MWVGGGQNREMKDMNVHIRWQYEGKGGVTLISSLWQILSQHSHPLFDRVLITEAGCFLAHSQLVTWSCSRTLKTFFPLWQRHIQAPLRYLIFSYEASFQGAALWLQLKCIKVFCLSAINSFSVQKPEMGMSEMWAWWKLGMKHFYLMKGILLKYMEVLG